MAKLLDLTPDNYDQITLESDVPVLVDFWAFWCGPCKTLAPILEDIQDQLGETATIAKLDVEKFPEIAKREHVKAFPTMILYSGGVESSRVVGIKPRQYLLNLINQAMSSKSDDGTKGDLYTGLTIHDAIESNESDAIKTVLSRDPDSIETLNANGETPIRSVLLRRFISAVPLLLEASPKLEFIDHVALNHTDQVRTGLDRNPSLISSYPQEDMSILDLAALWGADGSLAELLRRSPPISDFSDQKQANLLQMSVWGLKLECIQMLFDAGIKFQEDPNQPLVAMSIRPLESRNSLEVMKLLIEKGAIPNPQMHGKTVSEIAREIGWKELLPELEKLTNQSNQ